MNIKIKTDPSLNNDEIVITANRPTNEVKAIASLIANYASNRIPVYRDKDILFVAIRDIEYFYTDGKKVCIDTEDGKFDVKYKIYELEDMLDNNIFVKIEQGVIANIKKITNIKLLINGTMQIRFASGNTQYASRRCVSEIKKRLGI